MKVFFQCIIILALSGVIVSGCRTHPPPKAAQKTPQKKSAANSGADALALPNEMAAVEPEEMEEFSTTEPAPDGNPEALARFATGLSYELNDKSDLALDEFQRSALADPSNEPLIIELSRRYLRKKQPAKALELLSKSAARPKASGTIYSWLSRAYLEAGKTNSAIQASRVAIQKTPDSLEGYQSLAHIYLRTGQPANAFKVLNQAALHGKGDPEFLINLAQLYLVYLKIQPKEMATVKPRALELLRKASDLKPASMALVQSMAEAFEHLGDDKTAARLYLKMLSVLPEESQRRAPVREKLANLYLRADDKKAATEQLEAIVRDNPTRYPAAWHFLGTLAYDAKKFGEAQQNFEKALLLDPQIEQAYYDLALVQIDLHKTDDALQTLEKAREKFKDSFVGEFFTGLAHTRLKDYAEAVKHFTAAEIIARAKEPKRLNHQFYFQVGAACERNHDYKQAGEYFQKCIKESPNFSEALNYLGYMWAERGENLAKARELIEKAVKLEPKNGAYLDSMGWVLFKLNHASEALPYLLKAQEFTPEPDATLLDHLGDVYMALHQLEKARDAWKKSLSIESNEEIKKKLEQAGGNS